MVRVHSGLPFRVMAMPFLRSAVISRFLLAIVVSLTALPGSAQNPSDSIRKASDAATSEKRKTQTTPEPAVVLIQPSKFIYNVGDGIPATVSLVAGDNGVYVSRHFGPSGGNIPGFSLTLEYPDGASAQTCGAGSVADSAAPMLPPSEVFKNEFIFLKPGEERKIEMGISCPVKKPGVYRLHATYEPNYPQTDRVAELPETHGLVLRKTIHAQTVGIEVR